MDQTRSQRLSRTLMAAVAATFSTVAIRPARLPAAAAVPAVLSARPSIPIRLDGKPDEWTGAPRFTDAKTGAELAFQNDGRSLYILLSFTKPESAEAALASGMVVLGGPGGKPKEAKGVLFLRREVSAEAYIGWRERRGDLLTDEDKSEIRKLPRHPVSLAYAMDAGGRTFGPLMGSAGTLGPDFGLIAEDGTAVYEFRVPLDPSADLAGGFPAAPGASIRVTLNWGGPGRKTLSPHTGRESPTLRSGDLSGAGLTWAQEFIDTFDSMSRPTIGAKSFAVAVDVKLADRD